MAENADPKPVEGLASVGATWGQRMWLGVIPQVAPNGLSYAMLPSDFWSHKTHATRDNRSGKLTIATGGDAKGTWPPGMKPDWVGKATASPPSIWGRVIW